MGLKEVIVPCAGMGTRMNSLTKGKGSKLMLDLNGVPMISSSLDSLIDYGIPKIHVIANEVHQDLQDYVKRGYPSVNLISTPPTKGSAHSILQVRNFVSETHFGVILPDLLFEGKTPLIKQVDDIFSRSNSNTLAWISLNEDEKKKFGRAEDVSCTQIDENLYQVDKIILKNEISETSHYVVSYVASQNFFKISQNFLKRRGELDDTDVLKEMLNLEQFYGGELFGDCYDLGKPEEYLSFTKNH